MAVIKPRPVTNLRAAPIKKSFPIIAAGRKAVTPTIARKSPIQFDTAGQLTSAPIMSKYLAAEAKEAKSIQPYPRIANGPKIAKVANANMAKTKVINRKSHAPLLPPSMV